MCGTSAETNNYGRSLLFIMEGENTLSATTLSQRMNYSTWNPKNFASPYGKKWTMKLPVTALTSGEKW